MSTLLVITSYAEFWKGWSNPSILLGIFVKKVVSKENRNIFGTLLALLTFSGTVWSFAEIDRYISDSRTG